MIKKPNFSNIGNYNSKETIKKRNNGSDIRSWGPKDYQHYITDDSFNKNYKDFVGTENPAHASLNNADGAVKELGFHTNTYINKFKTCEIQYSTYEPGKTLSISSVGRWGNWRNGSNSNDGVGTDIYVNDAVYLIPEVRDIQFSYKLEYASVWEEVLKLKAISFIDDAARNARILGAATDQDSKTGSESGKIFIPLYKKAPAFTGSTTLGVPSSIRFTFRFGQAGIFSGEEEVYKPIVALAKLYAPSTSTKNGFTQLDNNPAPTLEEQFIDIGKCITSGLQNIKEKEKDRVTNWGEKANQDPESKNDADAALNGVTDSNIKKFASALTVLQEKIYGSITRGIQESLSKVKVLNIRYGRIVLPPMVVHDVAWSFNTSQVDEYGFPFEGYIEFGGLETVKLATKEDIDMAAK